jgi:hypothetical protein
MAWWHCWGCRPPLTTFHIHTGFMESVQATSYAVDMHMGAPLHCYTWQSWPRFWLFGSAWLLWNYGIDDIVGTVDHHWLLPTFIFDVWKVFEHLHMLWIGIWVHPCTVTPGKVGPDFGYFGQRGYNEMRHDDIVEATDHHWLLLTSLLEYGKRLSTFICCG